MPISDYNLEEVKPTKFGGVDFKSRLEAKWALFFKEWGIRWEYEPVRFTDGDMIYTPDFRLHGRDMIEIKPTIGHLNGIKEKLAHFSQKEAIFVFVGMCPTLCSWDSGVRTFSRWFNGKVEWGQMVGIELFRKPEHKLASYDAMIPLLELIMRKVGSYDFDRGRYYLEEETIEGIQTLGDTVDRLMANWTKDKRA